MRGCLLEDLLYLPFNTDFRNFIVSFRDKIQILWVLLSRATIHDDPRPPTTMHKFAATTHAQPYFRRHYPRPAITSWATTHNHPQSTIIKPPPLTNNDSLPTTLLTKKILNYVFATTTIYPGEFKNSLNLFASTRRTPTKIFFQSVATVFTLNLHITNATEDKN